MPRKHRRQTRSTMSEGEYVCDECGESILIPLDVTAGELQEYVEDCPVCCCPNLITVEFLDGGEVRVWAVRE